MRSPRWIRRFGHPASARDLQASKSAAMQLQPRVADALAADAAQVDARLTPSTHHTTRGAARRGCEAVHYGCSRRRRRRRDPRMKTGRPLSPHPDALYLAETVACSVPRLCSGMPCLERAEVSAILCAAFSARPISRAARRRSFSRRPRPALRTGAVRLRLLRTVLHVRAAGVVLLEARCALTRERFRRARACSLWLALAPNHAEQPRSAAAPRAKRGDGAPVGDPACGRESFLDLQAIRSRRRCRNVLRAGAM